MKTLKLMFVLMVTAPAAQAQVETHTDDVRINYLSAAPKPFTPGGSYLGPLWTVTLDAWFREGEYRAGGVDMVASYFTQTGLFLSTVTTHIISNPTFPNDQTVVVRDVPVFYSAPYNAKQVNFRLEGRLEFRWGYLILFPDDTEVATWVTPTYQCFRP